MFGLETIKKVASNSNFSINDENELIHLQLYTETAIDELSENLIKFLIDKARENFDENDDNFNAGMSVLIGNVKNYFNVDDYDFPIRDDGICK